jgi:hypothetical protein
MIINLLICCSCQSTIVNHRDLDNVFVEEICARIFDRNYLKTSLVRCSQIWSDRPTDVGGVPTSYFTSLISPVFTFKSFQFLTYPSFKFDQIYLEAFNCISLHHSTAINRMMPAATNRMMSASAEKTASHQGMPWHHGSIL